MAQVLEAMDRYYELSNANVHRGAHALSIRATEAYEAARDKVQVRVQNARQATRVLVLSELEGLVMISCYLYGCGWQRFVNAASRDEIVFTKGATEAINLVANTWGMQELKAGDEVILSVRQAHLLYPVIIHLPQPAPVFLTRRLND